MLKGADFKRKGYITYDDFIAAAFDKKKLLSKRNLRKAFALFDSEGKGYFDRRKLAEMMNCADEP